MLLEAMWAQEDGTGCLDEQHPARPSFCYRRRPSMIRPFLICGMELRVRRRSELVKLWNEAPTPVLVSPG
jgi:hypothetical protein